MILLHLNNHFGIILKSLYLEITYYDAKPADLIRTNKQPPESKGTLWPAAIISELDVLQAIDNMLRTGSLSGV